MEPSTIVGTVGVSLLLLAFLLNLFNIISQSSLPYLIMNIMGAAIACVASILIWFIPFILLELIWVSVGIAGFYKYFKDRTDYISGSAPFHL